MNSLPEENLNPFKKMVIWPGLFLLSAAALAFEINLTRIFSVAQFYHFAFMIVSIALLGYGASGMALSTFPSLLNGKAENKLGGMALATAICILGAYLLVNRVPFDSYSITWDRKQVFILILHYIALATPFFFSGMALGMLLSKFPGQVSSTYAVNLLGSAAGCILALLAPVYLGGEGMVVLSGLLASLAALISMRRKQLPMRAGIISLLVVLLIALGGRLINQDGFRLFKLHISPYKSLSYALQNTDAEVIYSQWNSFSRVDLVQSEGIHSLPGLSYRYLGPLPKLDGLFVDGDDLSPVVQYQVDSAFTDYLPNAVAFHLHPQANTLILEPRGGLDIFTTFAHNSGWVTAVEPNPLVVEASPTYEDARLSLQIESGRSYLGRTDMRYDVILLSLVSSYHPVQSGAYSLAEDYRYTIQSFGEMLEHLAPGGVLVATRWLQDPPSEDLRLFALAVTAIEANGVDPHQRIVAFRGYNTATILVKNEPFTAEELNTIRKFTNDRAYDLTYAPDIQAEETNRYNILAESTYHQTYLELLEANPRQEFYDAYPYDVRPPTDDHPFYGHYFKWSQIPQILAEFGKALLPFGGGGYLVILALLILASILSGMLILLPVWRWRRGRKEGGEQSSPFKIRNLIYFGALGLAFLLVEIPLMQQFIVYLGNPAYAVTTVLFAILLFSGIGSQMSKRIPLLPSLGALCLVVMSLPLLLPLIFDSTLGLPILARLVISISTLAPAGFLMGIPFPGGIIKMTGRRETVAGAGVETEIPWIWAVNGAASVVAPILAALLALSAGFRVVLWSGALCYAAALVTVWVFSRWNVVPHPAR